MKKFISIAAVLTGVCLSMAVILIGVCLHSSCPRPAAAQGAPSGEAASKVTSAQFPPRFRTASGYSVCLTDGDGEYWLTIEESGQSRCYFLSSISLKSWGTDKKLSPDEMARLRDCFQRLPEDSGRPIPIERTAFISYPGEKGRVFKNCDMWCIPKELVTIYELADRTIGPWYPGRDAKPVRILKNAETDKLSEDFLDMTVLPDGRSIATVDRNGVIQYWNVQSGEGRLAMNRWGFPAFSPSGGPDFVAVAPDGSYVATKVRDKGLVIMNQLDGSSRPMGVQSHRDLDNLAVSFSRDGKFLAVKLDLEVNLYDVGTLQWKRTINTGKPVSRVQFHPGGRMIALATGERVAFFDIATGEERSAVKLEPWRPFSCSPDGKMVAAIVWDGRVNYAQGTVGERAVYQVHDISSIKKPRLRLEGEIYFGQEAVRDIAWTPDSSTFAIATWGSVWLIDSETGERLAAFDGGQETEKLSILSDGVTLLSLQRYGGIQVFNIQKYLKKYRSEQKPVRVNQ